MRKLTLSLFATLLTLAAYCGAPQGINYQAVASGATGPIKNKAVSFRLSILDGSAVGPQVYQERQDAVTDNNGLSSFQIGIGGSSVVGVFKNIDWSKGVYFLKTELDTNGGTTYKTIGTVQFFSVPYAFYSDKSGASNLATQDFPDGLNNITPIRLNGSFNYTVAPGKTLYITDITSNDSAACPTFGVVVDGVTLSSSAATTSNHTSIAKTIDGTITIPAGKALSSTSCGTSLVGYIMDQSYQWVLFDLNSGSYTVPNGKIFVINTMIMNSTDSWTGQYSVGGLATRYTKNIAVADQNQTITATGNTGPLLMMGYVKTR
jgi:hypothetical protein